MNNQIINLNDIGIKYIILRDSGTYLIDGKVINKSYGDNKEVAVQNVDDIRLVTNIRIIEKYVNAFEEMTVDEYKANILELNREYFEDCDEEYVYKCFIRDWKPIYREEQRISEPIKVEIVESCYKPENKYISNCFFNGTDLNICLFKYDRPTALLDIVKKCFEKVGMEYVRGGNYKDTMNQKIWTNSEHSCIEYVQAFGTYIFSNLYKNTKPLTGTLKDMEDRYNNDYKAIKSIITSKYNMMFGNKNQDLDFNLVVDKLQKALDYFSKIDVKQKSIQDYRTTGSYLREAKQLIIDYFSEEG